MIFLAILLAILLYTIIKAHKAYNDLMCPDPKDAIRGHKEAMKEQAAYLKHIHDDMEHFNAESEKFKPLNLTAKYS